MTKMHSVKSRNDVPVRLTDERWTHITENHCEMAGFRIEVLVDEPHGLDGEKEAAMALIDVAEYLEMIPVVMASPQKHVWLSYDAEADVLYVTFRRPSRASESEMTDEDVIVRYEGDEVVGLTVLNASKRKAVH